MVFKIGTRKSLLAKTQSSQIKKILEGNTGKSFKLEFIVTAGDQDQKTPLHEMQGNNFFTKELDTALLEDKVDFNIHSHKDLGSLRPNQFCIGAVSRRSFAHDILLIRKEIKEKLLEGDLKELRIGTSSPRRNANLKRHFKNLINYDGNLSINNLRGNVNTRIQKLQDNQYDAIVLALAGVERLAQDEASRLKLSTLIKDLDFLVLPLSLFPGASAQGALAIEIKRGDQSRLSSILDYVHDEVTAFEIHQEREAFNYYGGGCHLPVGIFVKKFEDGYIECHQGYHQKEINILNLNIQRPNKIKTPYIFIGLPESKSPKILKEKPMIYNEFISNVPLNYNKEFEGNILVTSTNTYQNIDLKQFTPNSIWASGVKTMKKLFQNKKWVNGCGDFLGEAHILELKSSQFIQLLLTSNEWYSLTNDQTNAAIGNTIKTYSRKLNQTSAEFDAKIQSCKIFYWMSRFQYEEYLKKYPIIKNALHCTGLGKTYKYFKENNIPVIPFVSLEEFHNWLN